MRSDTDPRTERVLVDLVRKANPQKRLVLIGALSATVHNLSRRTISRVNPSLSQRERNILFLDYRRYLERKQPQWIVPGDRNPESPISNLPS